MTLMFQTDRSYSPEDAEMSLIGSKEKLAQWRHKGIGPSYFKLGKKIIYQGSDLNEWVESQKVTSRDMEAV